MLKVFMRLFESRPPQPEVQSLIIGSALPQQEMASAQHPVEPFQPTESAPESVLAGASVENSSMTAPDPALKSDQKPAPTKAFQEGEAQRSTDEWRNAVQEGTHQWGVKMQQLMERIQNLQKQGGADSIVLLLMVASYYHLDFDQETVLEQDFPKVLQLRIERDLAVPKYNELMKEKTKTRWNSYPRSVDFYVEEFVSLRSCFLDGFIHMVDTLPQMLDVVDGLYEQIKAAEQELMPARKGDHLLRFRGFMSRLAQEQLPGVRPLDFFPEHVPGYIRDYYASDIKISGSLILWALSGVVKSFARTSTANSTSQVGIEFEQRLMREICETFPGAKIESTPVSGDQGADVLVTIEGIKFAIQAKRYTGVVGNAAVQEVFAAQQFYEADYAMVVTTSRYTNPAQALAQKIGVELSTADDYLRRMQQLLI